MSIKIYKGFDSTFTIPTTTPSALYFIYEATGSNITISGSFTTVSSGTEVYLTSAQTTNFTVGSPWLYAIIDSEPTFVDIVTVTEITTITQTHAQKCLSAIEAMIEGRASVEVQELSIGGRTLKYIPIADLLKLKAYYTKAVADEQKKMKIANGLGVGNKINIRFR